MRMLRAPGLILALWAAGFVVAAPLAVLMLEAIHAFGAASEYPEALMEGFDTGWYAEFSDSGSIPATFSPSQTGVGAWLENVDAWWDGSVFVEHPAILATGAVFVLVWLLVMGGVLESMREGAARPRLATVVGDGLRFFPRLARISVVSAVGYLMVFRFARWLFPRIHEFTADATTETKVLIWNLGGALVVLLLVGTVRLVSDYAKIAAVVERRRSALLSVVRGLRFVASNPLRISGLVLWYTGSMAILFGVYSLLAPEASDSTRLAIVLGFGLGQLFLVIKTSLRVAWLAAEVALFEMNR
ncbi:MAG: hypothetical protein KJO44_04740 [Gemmatimonadetes bacterium]|nr:hypothetical protein [Gemmatimonadota bacterium]